MDIAAIAYLPAEDELGVDPDIASEGSLERALQRIATGEFSTLVVLRLQALAGSLVELIALIDWLDGLDACLLARDVGLDTGSAAGRQTVAALREIARWEHEPKPGRPPRGRPGLSVQAPELTERIARMRERGLSLQAIANHLNADEVPTPRGGAQWRPSSVQAALGYRRPPPKPPLPPSAIGGRGRNGSPSGRRQRGRQPGSPRPGDPDRLGLPRKGPTP